MTSCHVLSCSLMMWWLLFWCEKSSVVWFSILLFEKTVFIQLKCDSVTRLGWRIRKVNVMWDDVICIWVHQLVCNGVYYLEFTKMLLILQVKNVLYLNFSRFTFRFDNIDIIIALFWMNRVLAYWVDWLFRKVWPFSQCIDQLLWLLLEYDFFGCVYFWLNSIDKIVISLNMTCVYVKFWRFLQGFNTIKWWCLFQIR